MAAKREPWLYGDPWESCETCAECSGNGIGGDGNPCLDCEGTGCAQHPFCDADHEEEEAFRHG